MLLVLPILEGLGQETSALSEGNGLLNSVDRLFRGVPEDQLLQTAAFVFLGLTIVRAGVAMMGAALQGWLQARLDRQLREEVYLQILHLPYENLNQRRDSDWQLILNSETGRAAGAIFNLVSMASSFITMLVYVGVLLLVSWQMTLIAAVLLVLVFIALTWLVRIADRAGQHRFNHALTVQHGTNESLNAKRIIRIMNQQDYERDKYFDSLKYLQKALVIIRVVAEASRQMLEVLIFGLLALLLLIGGTLLDVDQAAMIPILSTFILIVYRMLPHVLSLNTLRTSISAELATVRNIAGLLEVPEAGFVVDGTQSFTGLQDKIRFEGVSFRYTNRNIPAVNDISLEIERGQTVALVGLSGAGKSTLADLLIRLYDPQTGNICIDGVNLRDLKLADWRRHVGVVSQDTFIFNHTIAYNIQYGTFNTTQAEIEQAARYANAHDFITELPKGYETMVGDRGVLLSGGQRQRIAIARAILRDPQILILDEATSALDSVTERLIQDALDHLSQNRTALVIAHRLSTILSADKIVAMREGRIVEQGRHDELLRLGGYYAELYSTQFENVTAPQ